MRTIGKVLDEFNEYFRKGLNPEYDSFTKRNVKQFISDQITQLLEELREEDIQHDDLCPATTWGKCECLYHEKGGNGYNQRNQILNSKIDKILNNK